MMSAMTQANICRPSGSCRATVESEERGSYLSVRAKSYFRNPLQHSYTCVGVSQNTYFCIKYLIFSVHKRIRFKIYANEMWSLSTPYRPKTEHGTTDTWQKWHSGVSVLDNTRVCKLANVLLAMAAHSQSAINAVMCVCFMCDKSSVAVEEEVAAFETTLPTSELLHNKCTA